jgi:hypothetical protein
LSGERRNTREIKTRRLLCWNEREQRRSGCAKPTGSRASLLKPSLIMRFLSAPTSGKTTVHHTGAAKANMEKATVVKEAAPTKKAAIAEKATVTEKRAAAPTWPAPWLGSPCMPCRRVLAATAPIGVIAVQTGTLVKLVRVLMLGPVVLILSLLANRLREQTERPAPDLTMGKRPARRRPPLHQLVPWFAGRSSSFRLGPDRRPSRIHRRPARADADPRCPPTVRPRIGIAPWRPRCA